MVKRVTLTLRQKVDIIKAYENELTPMIELARTYGITRQGVYMVLKRAGVDTKNQLIPVSCAVCHKELLRNRARIRRQLNHFCGHPCYSAFISNGKPHGYWREEKGTSSRLARSVVSQYFQLQQGHTVHHENQNRFDNSPKNLRVFANSGDHARHHRGFDVQPIWDGNNP